MSVFISNEMCFIAHAIFVTSRREKNYIDVLGVGQISLGRDASDVLILVCVRYVAAALPVRSNKSLYVRLYHIEFGV